MSEKNYGVREEMISADQWVPLTSSSEPRGMALPRTTTRYVGVDRVKDLGGADGSLEDWPGSFHGIACFQIMYVNYALLHSQLTRQC